MVRVSVDCVCERSFNGWSLTYIEALDTLWIMGLYEEFDGALAAVANITFFMPDVSRTIPVLPIMIPPPTS